MGHRSEREHWEDFRANAAELLLDTMYLALAVGCIAGLHALTGFTLPPRYEIVPNVPLDAVFNAGHAAAIGRWLIIAFVRMAQVRERSRNK